MSPCFLLCIFATFLSSYVLALTVPPLSSLRAPDNETLAGLSVSRRCPLTNHVEQLDNQYYNGNVFEDVHLQFWGMSFDAQIASRKEMMAIVSCWSGWERMINQVSSGLGIPPDPFLCVKEVYSDQVGRSRVEFHFRTWTSYMHLSNISRAIGLELVDFLRYKLFICSRDLSTFWASGKYQITTRMGLIAEVDWVLRR